MIEQDFNFGSVAPKRSKVDPPREYLMRFIRWVASGILLDEILTMACQENMLSLNRELELKWRTF
jgi:hypothetical protein